MPNGYYLHNFQSHRIDYWCHVSDFKKGLPPDGTIAVLDRPVIITVHKKDVEKPIIEHLKRTGITEWEVKYALN